MINVDLEKFYRTKVKSFYSNLDYYYNLYDEPNAIKYKYIDPEYIVRFLLNHNITEVILNEIKVKIENSLYHGHEVNINDVASDILIKFLKNLTDTKQAVQKLKAKMKENEHKANKKREQKELLSLKEKINKLGFKIVAK